MSIQVSELRDIIPTLKAGDFITLSGVVYTARDAAHKKICELLDKGEKLPFELDGSAIYYAGPTAPREGIVIGSCGPTTSSRMDKFAPRLLDLGLVAMIGKGKRSKEVIDAIVRNKAIYLCAVGGAGAIASKSIVKCDVIAFPELGCEAVRRLEFKDFPLVVGIDCNGVCALK
ncbi:MAG: FumA C-terminus/TtdB family hydratase beta subunit [Clostridia bacterium]|nr:FumA C-terminus/TtdB family hydratase beta subunit [Clostridia bacterium]